MIRIATFLSLTFLISGHFRISDNQLIKPRSAADNLKVGPCGNAAPKTDPNDIPTLFAGDTVTISWEETINHPGWYRIAFSPDGQNGFDDNVIADNITDTQNGQVNRNDPTTYHRYSRSFTVPDTECSQCAIQMIQVMTDRNPPTNYYSCADVRIVKRAETGTKPAAPTNLKVKFIGP